MSPLREETATRSHRMGKIFSIVYSIKDVSEYVKSTMQLIRKVDNPIREKIGKSLNQTLHPKEGQ